MHSLVSPGIPRTVMAMYQRICFVALLLLQMRLGWCAAPAQDAELTDGSWRAAIVAADRGDDLREYTLTSNAELRDNSPADHRIVFQEAGDHAVVRSGNPMFDGLYALAVAEALKNSVSEIRDRAYRNGAPIRLPAFQTGAFWTYVWTRDLSYSTQLALAGFDPARAASSLFFKTSGRKPSVTGGYENQIIQDTGSGGSYPISTDRIVWVLGAYEILKYLPEPERRSTLERVYPIVRDTLEEDRRLVFDPADGLYRGEQSFLDWRQQTYPGWTKNDVLPIGMSKALSVNVADYFALQTASRLARELGRSGEQNRYADWATALKSAINRRFYDSVAGLYSTYLFTDADAPVRAQRYDLLGESLAVLLGVASAEQAQSVIAHYPVGSFGPPVVWPEEKSVPIYHNQAIWPFVTAYWTKAARAAGNADAVDRGIVSLMRGAAFNLSNMENFDVASGRAQVKAGPLTGPVINSQRQIWSVAGYLAMVQDVVFGLETSWDGIRFRPGITARLRRDTFGATDTIELRRFGYLGKMIDVRVHLPPKPRPTDAGWYRIARCELNGAAISDAFVPASALRERNGWDVFLGDLEPDGPPIRVLDFADERQVFGPAQPEWDAVGQGGITADNGRLTLHYRADDAGHVTFTIYRDGQVCADHVASRTWTDPASNDYRSAVHFYTLTAVDEQSGLASHLAPSRHYVPEHAEIVVPATAFENRGGRLIDAHYFSDWGAPADELRVANLRVDRSGRFQIRVEYANASGPINTGITCAVKRLEVRDSSDNALVADGYLVMPQLEKKGRFELSSIVRADLQAGKTYTIRISEDEYARNMSYLRQNEDYTAHPGGGTMPFNRADIAELRLLRVGD